MPQNAEARCLERATTHPWCSSMADFQLSVNKIMIEERAKSHQGLEEDHRHDKQTILLTSFSL